MGCSISCSKREVYNNAILPQETKQNKQKSSKRQPNFAPKTTGKRKTNKQKKKANKQTKISRKKKIIKIRVETNGKEMKEAIIKINKTKIWFFEKISKIEKPYTDSSRKK